MAAALPLIEEQRDILDLAGKAPEAPSLTDRPLSPRRKHAWELHQKGVPYKEIAQIMGCNPSSVNTYVHETRKQLGITREEVLQCMRERARKRFCGDDVLTSRQREAWELKQQGLMGKEIAKRMVIYPSGVRIMLKEARKRLGETGG